MKKTEKLTVVLFTAFLLVMFLGTLLPKDDFSQNEKRYLTKFPSVSWDAVSSGAWGEKLESWMADHTPARDFFVGLDAYKNLLLGVPGEIRVLGDRLVEAPVTVAEAQLSKNRNAIRKFAGSVDAPVTLALVPSAGWAAGQLGSEDDAIIAEIQAQAGSDWQPLDLTKVFAGKPELYYKTDHHWTSAGAFAGYSAIAEAFGRDIRTEYTIEKIPACFQGSTYSRSALWLTKPEDLELWHGSEDITVVTSESSQPHGVFYRERLEEADKYTVFLDGNHAQVTLTNPGKTGKLLVIRDSYSNCLGPFLAESWGQVELVDLRYFKRPVSELAADADEILVLYSIGNFLTDGNLVFLR